MSPGVWCSQSAIVQPQMGPSSGHSRLSMSLDRAVVQKSSEKNLKSIGVRDGMGGQGQYRVGRGSIGWAGAVSAVLLPKSDFQHIKKPFMDAFLVSWVQKIDII